MLREVSRSFAMARGEVTGKKLRTNDAAEKQEKQPSFHASPPPPFARAFTIAEFCKAHRISQTTYFELKKSGEGPDEMAAGRRRIISQEAAARWRKAREVAAAEAAE
jgi:hypothetical protein